MKQIPAFMMNKNVVGATAFRLYCIFVQSNESYPHRRSHRFTRGNLEQITKYSYNSIQKGLKQLFSLGLIKIDPFDITRTHFIINSPENFNWTEINMRQGLKFERAPETDEDF